MKNGFSFQTKSSRSRINTAPERDETSSLVLSFSPLPASSFSGFSEVALWNRVLSSVPLSDWSWQLPWPRRVGSGLAVARVTSLHGVSYEISRELLSLGVRPRMIHLNMIQMERCWHAGVCLGCSSSLPRLCHQGRVSLPHVAGVREQAQVCTSGCPWVQLLSWLPSSWAVRGAFQTCQSSASLSIKRVTAHCHPSSGSHRPHQKPMGEHELASGKAQQGDPQSRFV